jgi:hypothetical protein
MSLRLDLRKEELVERGRPWDSDTQAEVVRFALAVFDWACSTFAPVQTEIRLRKIDATDAFFIKLGRAGEWEDECLRDGSLRFGYRETPHELGLSGNWDAVRNIWQNIRGDAGTATRDMMQIRTFYSANQEALFVTFSNGLLHWCHPGGPVEVLPDRSRRRRTVDGWHSRTAKGLPLTMDRLSGQLLKVQMFRGTICQVKAANYLLRKLNDELSPEVAAAEDAEQRVIAANVGLMRLLTWQDFELLIDLVFSTSGWRRIGVVGRAQKTVDLELQLPTTGERAFVQIKSQANAADFREYMDRFKESEIYDHMFFVWHSGTITVEGEANGVTLVGPEQLARMVVEAGLSSWLREKVS